MDSKKKINLLNNFFISIFVSEPPGPLPVFDVIMVLQWKKYLSKYDASCQSDVIYFDIKKAFDTVPLRQLLLKLQSYGFAGEIVTWIEDFLNGRRQKVTVHGDLQSSVFSSYRQYWTLLYITSLYVFAFWLVGCFGFNGPLRQYFSLYRAVSQRQGERGEKG